MSCYEWGCSVLSEYFLGIVFIVFFLPHIYSFTIWLFYVRTIYLNPKWIYSLLNVLFNCLGCLDLLTSVNSVQGIVLLLLCEIYCEDVPFEI